MKEKNGKAGKTFLVDTRLLLLSVVVIAVPLLFADLVSMPGDGFYGAAQPAFVRAGDARAFLFFDRADVNRISLEGLDSISGIGMSTAQKIIDFRQECGFILDIDELAWPQGPLKPSRMAAARAWLKAMSSSHDQ